MRGRHPLVLCWDSNVGPFLPQPWWVIYLLVFQVTYLIHECVQVYNTHLTCIKIIYTKMIGAGEVVNGDFTLKNFAGAEI